MSGPHIPARLNDEPRDRSGFTAGAVGVISSIVAAWAIGSAIHLHGGEYTPGALALVTLGLIASAVAVVLSNRNLTEEGQSWVNWALGIALVMQLAALLVLWPVGVDQRLQDTKAMALNHRLYLYETGVAALLIVVGWINLPSMRRWWFPCLLLVHLVLGIWTIRNSSEPAIDVWYFQEAGVDTLLQGKNPYDARDARFPDIYHSSRPGQQQVYGQGLVVDDHLMFGFPYPPLSLYCSTIGYVLGKDVRYGQAVALTLAGLFIGYCGMGRTPKLAAALLLFTPAEWFILGRAWTEPFVVMFLAATIFCACRNLRWLLPVALGLFIASKQYLAFVIPLSFLLVADFKWGNIRSWGKWALLLTGAGIVAALVTLPLALRNFPAYWFSTVLVQKKAPFRWDALSYLVWAALHLNSRYTAWVWVPFAAVAPALGLSFFKARRGPAGFAAAMALVYLVFIAFNKQAFCNYYFFVIGCLCCAIAALGPTTLSPQMDTDGHR